MGWVWFLTICLLAGGARGFGEFHGVIEKCFPDIQYGEHSDVEWELDADMMVQREEWEYAQQDTEGGARSFVHLHDEEVYAPVYKQKLANLTKPARVSFWARLVTPTSQLHISFLRSGSSVINIKILGNTVYMDGHAVDKGVQPMYWFRINFYLTGWQQPKGLTVSIPLSQVSHYTLPGGVYSGIDEVATWSGGNPTWIDLLSFDCVYIPPRVYLTVEKESSLTVSLSPNEGSFHVFEGDALFFAPTPDCYLDEAIANTMTELYASTTAEFTVNLPSPHSNHPSRGQRYFLCYKAHGEGFIRSNEDGWSISYSSSTVLSFDGGGCLLGPMLGRYAEATFDCGRGTETFTCNNGTWDKDPFLTCVAGIFNLPAVEGGILVDGSCVWDEDAGLLTGCTWVPIPGSHYCDNTEATWDVVNQRFVPSAPLCTRGCFPIEGAELLDMTVPSITRHSTTVSWKRKDGYVCNEKWTNRIVDSRDISQWSSRCYNGLWRRMDILENTLVTCHQSCNVLSLNVEGADITDSLHREVMHGEKVRWSIWNGYLCDVVVTSCIDGSLETPVCKQQQCQAVDGMSYTCQKSVPDIACRYHALPDANCAKWMGYQLGDCEGPELDCTKSPSCRVPTSSPEGAWSPCLQENIVKSTATCAWRPFPGYFCKTLITTCGPTGYLAVPECTFMCDSYVAGTVTNCTGLVPKGEFCSFSAIEGHACTAGTFECTGKEWPWCNKFAGVQTPVPTAPPKGSAVQFSMEVAIVLYEGLDDNSEVTNDIAAKVVGAISGSADVSLIVLETLQVVKICGISNDTFHSVNSFTCVYPVPLAVDMDPLTDAPAITYYLEFSFNTYSSSSTRIERSISDVLYVGKVLSTRSTITLAPTIKTTTVVFTPRPVWAAAPTLTPALSLLVILLL